MVSFNGKVSGWMFNKHWFEEVQTDLDGWMADYNEQWPHQGCWCYGTTQMQTFMDSAALAKEEILAGNPRRTHCLSDEVLSYTEEGLY